MSLDGRRTLTLVVVCCAALGVGVERDVETALYDDPPDAIAIQPPTGVGSGTGTFEYLDDAINSNPFDGSIGSVQVRCRDTCLNQVEKSAEWQGFPDGFEPLRLEIRWDAIGSISLAAGREARVDLKLEYDLGGGWQTAVEEAWINEIPSCSEAHPSRCADNTFVLELAAQQSTGAIKVKATAKAKMTACGNCGLFDTSAMSVIMAVRHIQLIVRGPRLIAEPSYTVTRGDSVTFRVVGSPVTSFSNWRYEPTGHPAIVRSENINTDSWTGPLVLGGKAKVVVIVPGQQSSIPLETTPAMTVNPRAWNSLAKQPVKVTGITPNPPGVFSTTNLGGHMGYSTWYLTATFDAVKLDGDAPNKGLSYVTAIRHAEDAAVHFSYEIAPDLEPGTTFYARQCGQGGFILGSVLRTNTYEHESGTQMGHYQQYRDKLAEAAVNYAKYAEPLWGAVSQTLQGFQNTVQDGINSRRTTLHNAAGVQACNADVTYDPTCTFRGNINYPPYLPPCQ